MRGKLYSLSMVNKYYLWMTNAINLHYNTFTFICILTWSGFKVPDPKVKNSTLGLIARTFGSKVTF